MNLQTQVREMQLKESDLVSRYEKEISELRLQLSSAKEIKSTYVELFHANTC